MLECVALFWPFIVDVSCFAMHHDSRCTKYAHKHNEQLIRDFGAQMKDSNRLCGNASEYIVIYIWRGKMNKNTTEQIGSKQKCSCTSSVYAVPSHTSYHCCTWDGAQHTRLPHILLPLSHFLSSLLTAVQINLIYLKLFSAIIKYRSFSSLIYFNSLDSI